VGREPDGLRGFLPEIGETYTIFSTPIENKKTFSKQNRKSNYVWVLQDINFELKRCEVLGLIGQ